MITCYLCGFESIDGVDACAQCGQPFTENHLQPPSNAVERGLLVDVIACLSPKPPITVSASTTVGEVLKLLVDRQIGCVFIQDNGTITGVFSERDALLRLNTKAGELLDEPVQKFMTPNPQSLPPDAKIAYAVHQMDLGGYRHLPIVDRQGLAQGVISARDILHYLTRKLEAVARQN